MNRCLRCWAPCRENDAHCLKCQRERAMYDRARAIDERIRAIRLERLAVATRSEEPIL